VALASLPMGTGQEARDTKNMGKDAHATGPANRLKQATGDP
jgi:hypothetical protein